MFVVNISQAAFPVRSGESPISSGSFKACSIKAALDCQPSVLRIDDSLSPASLDSVVITERDAKNEKYAASSPLNSAHCLEDQVIFFSNKLFFPHFIVPFLISYLEQRIVT